MDDKKRATILVIIALVLAITAISLQFSDARVSSDASGKGLQEVSTSGIVGLVVGESGDVVDRGNDDTGGLRR